MRIALHIPTINSAEGGAFSFQNTVFNAFLGIAARSQHEFLVYTDAAPCPAPPNVQFSPLNNRFHSRAAAGFGRMLDQVQADSFYGVKLHFDSAFDKSLRRARVDAVWFTTPHFQECDVPYVYTVWDLQHFVQPWFPEVSAGGEWLARKAFYDRTISRAVRVIVPNETARAEVLRAFPIGSERLLLLPHPAPTVAEQPGSRVDVRAIYAIRKPFVFYPAQFWPHKNHVTLLHALRLLRDQEHLDLAAVLSGSDKGNRTHVEKTAQELGIADDVHMPGFVPSEHLAAFYASAEALTFVSFFGPENLPPLEAFALRCPVICSDYAGAREQLGDAAVYVAAHDAQQLARAISTLHSDPALRATLCERGVNRAKLHSGNEYVARVLAFFDEFAAVRRCWP